MVGYRRGAMNITTWVAVLFSIEIAGVFALELLGGYRTRRTCPARYAIDDSDGRTRVIYPSPRLVSLNANPATVSAAQ